MDPGVFPTVLAQPSLLTFLPLCAVVLLLPTFCRGAPWAELGPNLGPASALDHDAALDHGTALYCRSEMFWLKRGFVG